MSDRPLFDADIGALIDFGHVRPDTPLPADLSAFLLEAGVPAAEVASATQDDTLELLAIEHLVDLDVPRWVIEEVVSSTGVTAEVIRTFWRALGYPEPTAGEKVFGEADMQILSWVAWFMQDGQLGEDVALQMARVIGSSLERIASAQIDIIESGRVAAELAEVERSELATEPSAEEIALAMRRGAELFEMMPRLLEYVWRRHLSAAARRRRLRASHGEGAGVCVGFADLVGFTAQTQQLDEEELAMVVSRFETTAYDTVNAHGGRVVKMIGDEVMFVAETVTAGAELAIALSETYARDPALSDVRVGLASGPVLEREGDVYGPVVNLASRIVSIAYPGAVVVSQDVYDALADETGYELRTIRQHLLKDIGRVRLWTLQRADGDSEEHYERARQRHAVRREFLLRRRASWEIERRERTGQLDDDMAEMLDEVADAVTDGGEPATEEFEAITEAVLAADIDGELQIELLADIEASRRLAELEREAQRRALEADMEAEGRLEEIEDEARRKVERIESESRRRVEEALSEAELKADRVNEEATRKVKRVAEDAEKRAEQAEREAKRDAKRTAERARRKGKRDD